MKINAKNKKLVLAFVLLTILLAGTLAFFLRPTSTNISNNANNIIALPNEGNATSMNINFAKCDKGQDGIVFGLGSENYIFSGVLGNNCVVKYSQEIEMGQGPNELCKIPTNLGQQNFLVKDEGTDFIQKMGKYCK